MPAGASASCALPAGGEFDLLSDASQELKGVAGKMGALNERMQKSGNAEGVVVERSLTDRCLLASGREVVELYPIRFCNLCNQVVCNQVVGN